VTNSSATYARTPVRSDSRAPSVTKDLCVATTSPSTSRPTRRTQETASPDQTRAAPRATNAVLDTAASDGHQGDEVFEAPPLRSPDGMEDCSNCSHRTS
jgi:hypothetical protein